MSDWIFVTLLDSLSNLKFTSSNLLVNSLNWSSISFNFNKCFVRISSFKLSDLVFFKFNEEETPELFNSDSEAMNEETSKNSEEDQISEEDDLEIPAFLRRQKN